jgi:hypothetical protein
MPPDKSIPGSVQDWLVRAKGHLVLAKQPKPEGAFWEDQCFLAQQAQRKPSRRSTNTEDVLKAGAVLITNPSSGAVPFCAPGLRF